VTSQPTARFRATVHFNGSDFHGWQLQPTQRTVQGDLESCLERLFGDPTRISGAGRTDSGVHAAGQEVAFDAPARWEAAPDFHPRFQASGRRYEYLVGVGPESVSPLWTGRLWPVGRPLDLELLLSTSSQLIGVHDFVSLSKSGQPERGTECRVERAEWSRGPLGHARFTIVADRFLHRMVRYIVGTLVEIALGRRDPTDFGRLLDGDGDVRPPIPAPPYGLYLSGVRYGSEWNRPELFGEPTANGVTKTDP
jgi:tRNA pseudouridine38-40 synthase